METKSIRVSEEIYKALFEVAGRLQMELRRPVSVDETIRVLLENFKRAKISDLAGTWDVSEDEVEAIKESLKDGWRKWKSSV